MFPHTNSKFRLGQRFIRMYVARHLMKNCGYPVTIGKCINANWEKISLGDGSGIGNFSKIEAANIGKYVLIGEHCSIYSKNHIFLDKTRLICNQGYTKEKVVTIGNDVWICDRVIIMPGVVIGDGSVIAAGSIVTKDVEPYSVVAGVPAKIISKRI